MSNNNHLYHTMKSQFVRIYTDFTLFCRAKNPEGGGVYTVTFEDQSCKI